MATDFPKAFLDRSHQSLFIPVFCSAKQCEWYCQGTKKESHPTPEAGVTVAIFSDIVTDKNTDDIYGYQSVGGKHGLVLWDACFLNCNVADGTEEGLPGLTQASRVRQDAGSDRVYGESGIVLAHSELQLKV